MAVLDHVSEPVLRLVIFAGTLALMAGLEAVSPQRRLRAGRVRRWTTNLVLAVTGSVTVRLLGALAGPLVATGAAVVAARHGVGLFHQLDWSAPVVFTASLLALDFAIWLQHVISHKVPLLWRLHRMHHADIDIDVTTGIRFHPVEIALSMLYKVAWVLALGAPVAAVVAFEVILNACALFNHANLALPAWLDRVLRAVIVTPDMHRVHHSIDPGEHDSNFGFNLSVWDRLFRTYLAAPAAGQHGMTVGLPAWQDEAPTGLAWCLTLPLRAAQIRVGTCPRANNKN